MSLSIKKQVTPKKDENDLVLLNRNLTQYMLDKGYADTIKKGLADYRRANLKFKDKNGTTYHVSCARSHNWYEILLRDRLLPIHMEIIHAHPKYVAIKTNNPRFNNNIYMRVLDELFGDNNDD